MSKRMGQGRKRPFNLGLSGANGSYGPCRRPPEGDQRVRPSLRRPPVRRASAENRTMKTIIRRLRRLEDRYRPPVETRFTRRLRERIEEGRQRVAEAMGLSEWPGSVGDDEAEDLRDLSVNEILLRGRAKVARATEISPKAIGFETALGPGNSTGCSSSLSTITMKKTRHLSHPPSQHTRQSSMRSPSDTGRRSRRNFV